MANKEKLFMFLHVPKTAGNTMRDVFSQNYLFKRMTTYYPDFGTTPEQWVDRNHANVSKSDALFGHFGYGIHELFPGNRTVSYGTMLRHPVDRTISYYHFARKYSEHYLHKEIIRMSLPEFVKSGVSSEIDNGQVRILASWEAMNRDKCSESDYQLALDHLNAMVVVGIQEMFDESIFIMKNKLGWNSSFYTSKNVGKKNKSAIDAAVLDEIREMNHYDMKLYQAAHDRLMLDISNIEDFDKSLQEMRKLNGTVGKLGKFVWDACVRLAVRGDGH
ncbi:MAG: sulfotransferase family 2 domain-containing protein [Sideroxydans sp.]|nr:sulfotransferase family 2 domain-containing protein [Sideroxydans sp.]